MSWIRKDRATTIDDFLKNFKPSQVTCSQCAWISVSDETGRRSSRFRRPTLIDDPLSECQIVLNNLEEKLKNGEPQAIHGPIRGGKIKMKTKIQIRNGACESTLTGKWVLFSDTDHIDDTWAKVAKDVVQGRLGSSAKVAPKDSAQSMHLICVYVEDFTDIDDVRRLDLFTRAGIYSGNKWGLSPSIFTGASVRTDAVETEMRKLQSEHGLKEE
ncbi:hypothetical protein BC829DRAFT_386753 [Chytridium lagenaria]|nr:hypothetical protein BC829DRAFT_386753 [Chytridium lagenaria]